MRAITIHQPWASLIAIGAKRFETRGWATNYRGPIAIHAGKQKDADTCLMLASEHVCIWRNIVPMPFGSIIATAELIECWEVIGDADVPIPNVKVLNSGNRMFGMSQDTDEFHFGDYSIGRFAWELSNVKMLAEPIPAKGQQRLWNWNHEGDEMDD